MTPWHLQFPPGGALNVVAVQRSNDGQSLENFLQFVAGPVMLHAMTQPLALICYEKLLPGTQLVNRLQDLGYRVETTADAGALADCARQHKPMLLLVDLVSTSHDVVAAVARVRQDPATLHIPVIAFAPDESPDLEGAVRSAGATLVVSEGAILSQLPHLLEQALQVE